MKKYLSIFFLIFLFFTINANASKTLYLSYLSVPKQVYKNQRFEVKIKAIITSENFDTIYTSFSNTSNIKVLNPESPWVKTEEQVYENSFYFRSESTRLNSSH